MHNVVASAMRITRSTTPLARGTDRHMPFTELAQGTRLVHPVLGICKDIVTTREPGLLMKVSRHAYSSKVRTDRATLARAWQ